MTNARSSSQYSFFNAGSTNQYTRQNPAYNLDDALNTVRNFASSNHFSEYFSSARTSNSNNHNLGSRSRNPNRDYEQLSSELNGVRQASATIAMVARDQGNRGLAKFSQGVSCASEFSMAALNLMEMSEAAAAAGTTVSTLSVMGPIGAMAAATYMFVSLFNDDDSGAEELNRILSEIDARLKEISEQIAMMHRDMRELFSINFDYQRQILEAVRDGFRLTGKFLINSHVEVMHTLQRIESTIVSLNRVLARQIEGLSLHEFRDVTGRAHELIEGSLLDEADVYTEAGKQEIRDIYQRLHKYTKSNGESAQRMFTGVNWLDAQSNDHDRYNTINIVFRDINPEMLAVEGGYAAQYEAMASLQGYLAQFAIKCLGIPLLSIKLEEPQPTPAELNASTNNRPLTEADRQLLTAAANGNLTAVRTALANQANVEAKLVATFNHGQANYIGNTPLLLAAHFGHAAVVDELLKRNANIHVKNAIGQGLLWLTAYNGHDAVIRLLFEKCKEKINYQLNAQNSVWGTPLHACNFNQCSSTISLLINLGADASTPDTINRTADVVATTLNLPALARTIKIHALNQASSVAEQVFNPLLWVPAASLQRSIRLAYLEALHDPQNVKITRSIAAGENYVHYVHSIRRSNPLIAALFKDYAAAMKEIERLIQVAREQAYLEENNNTKEKHPNIPHADIKPEQNYAEYMLAWESILPLDMTLTPGENVLKLEKQHRPPEYPLYGVRRYIAKYATESHGEERAMVKHDSTHVTTSGVAIKKLLAPLVCLQRFGHTTLDGSYDLFITHGDHNKATINITVNATVANNPRQHVCIIQRTFTQGTRNKEPHDPSPPWAIESFLHRHLGKNSVNVLNGSHVICTEHVDGYHTERLHNQAKECFNKFRFELDKTAINNLLTQGTLSTQLKEAFDKVNAIYRLIQAYCIVAGCNNETLSQARGLWTAAKFEEHLRAFTRSTNIIPLPHTNWQPNCESIKTTLLGIFRRDTTYQFQDSVYLSKVEGMVNQLKAVRNHPHIMETLRQQANAQANANSQTNGNTSSTENMTSSTRSTQNAFEGVTVATLREMFEQYILFFARCSHGAYHEDSTEQARSYRQQVYYNVLVKHINAIDSLISSIDRALMNANASNKSQMLDIMNQLSRINELTAGVHEGMILYGQIAKGGGSQYYYNVDNNSCLFLRKHDEFLRRYCQEQHTRPQPQASNTTRPAPATGTHESTSTPGRRPGR